MITEEAAGEILTDLFERRAQDRADARLVLQTVRERASRPRVAPPRAALVIAVAAAVIAIALVATFLVPNHSPSQASAAGQTTSVATSHPGEDQLSKTCLDMAKVLASWGSPTTGQAGIAENSPDGSQCSHEADIILPTHPAAVSSVVAGPRTVYLAQSPIGIRTGFLALNAIESAAAAAASGGSLSPGRSYYLIVSIPADNPQNVLASILQQVQLPG